MATTSTIETRVRGKRAAVPVLLEAFPLPPSFIPHSPLVPNVSSSSFPRSSSPLISSPKSPPSGPPSAPLPPVPGPSPITEHETLMFISAARSRRTSKMSLASVSTRDSIISADGSSPPSLSPSNGTPYDSSRSLRSFSSSSSLSVPLPRHSERSPVIQPRIAEEDAADLTRMSLDEILMHSPLPEHLSDDEKVLDIGISRRVPRYDPRDSISSVDMSEIPPLYDETDTEAPAPVLPPMSIPPRTRSLPRHLRHFAEKALPPLPPPPLTQPPPPPSETPPSVAPSQPLSHSVFKALSHTDRSNSPDIGEILATTPRPRRKSSHGSGLRSRSTSRAARGLKRTFSEAQSAPGSRRESVVSSGSGSHRTSAPGVPSLPHPHGRSREPPRPVSPSELAYAQTAMAHEPPESWNEDSFASDYGVPLDETGTPYDVVDGDEEARLDRELDGDGDDSDSSLDLHTPLPQLMVRDGLLSPKSKLFATSRGTTPLPDDRPGSSFSVASAAGSVMTKNGLFKDERDTVTRRTRHRDGKLLRGGIGLTTGLGWSDSEDEDAPSPLIRQMSNGSLQKRASAMSSRSLNSISRSYSGGHVSRSGTDEFGVLPKGSPSSAPPTSWQRPRLGPSLNRRTSTSSSLSSGSSTSAMSRTMSRASTSSFRSAPVGSSSRRNLDAFAKSLGYINEGAEMGFTTPSTSSSTASLVTPITPVDPPSQSRPRRGSASLKTAPAPVQLDLLSTSDLTPRRDVVCLNSPPKSSPALTPRKLSVPRPLRLPQVQGSLRTPSSASSTPSTWTPLSASAGPSSTPSLRHVPSQGLRQPQATTRSTSMASSAPSHGSVGFPSLSPAKPSPIPSSVPSSMSRLKPRTGTGMVYRTTPSAPAPPAPVVRASMMRMPSNKSLRSVKDVGIAI
ncbi:hypothetical protein LXA43DRAFT_971701 [Ganoderma leucocontextum]|nr:hypothetical protein LXA43DRAFT_971701 [Ganoderma leucocontextum]